MLIEGDWLGANRIVLRLALHPEIVVVVCKQFSRLLAGKMVAERANLYGFNVRVTSGLFAFLPDEHLKINLIRRSESPIEEGRMCFLVGKICRIRGNVKLVPIVDRQSDRAIILNGGVHTPLKQQTHENCTGTLRRHLIAQHLLPLAVVPCESMRPSERLQWFSSRNYSLNQATVSLWPRPEGALPVGAKVCHSSLKYRLAVFNRFENFDVLDFHRINIEWVSVEDDKIRNLANFE